MTPQEASEELKEEFEIFKDCIHKADWENPNEELRKIIEANSMAIEILSQQSCEDCISRQAVLEKAVIVPIAKVVTEDKVICRKIVFVEDIQKLPSVTPSRPKGKWIGEESLDGSIRYMCDNCKEFEYVDYYDFCPNCGADIRESEK